MSSRPDWLPEILTLDRFDGDMDTYLDEVYKMFRRDFVESCPRYKGRQLALKRYPLVQGQEATFWHIISKGVERRDINIERCERISWPRQIVEHCDDEAIKVWSNVRRGEKRILLWLEESNYVVILSERTGYTMLWTAYVVEPNRKAQFQREYEAFNRH